MKMISEASERTRQGPILDKKRKKMLMKKLDKIKLNRSNGNNSFFDIGAMYETRVRKLKHNNISLAKALAEQRQVSKTWYDEVVAMKQELHETQEDFLRHRIQGNGDCDAAIQAAAEKRIREIAEPLESAVKDSLENVFCLAESMTKVKSLLASLMKINNEKLNYSRSSHGSTGSRPPLSRTPKSPRKNVVHPMVEGHVLQPASIHIPRMSLEERRRYRLQEQAEIREEAGMPIIGETSTSVEEEVPDPLPPTEEVLEEDIQNLMETAVVAVEIVSLSSLLPGTPTVAVIDDLIEESPTVASSSRRGKRGGPFSPFSSPVVAVTVADAVVEESPPCSPVSKKARRPKKTMDPDDPLEGSSWMHTKRRRKSRKTPSLGGGPTLRRASAVQAVDNESELQVERLPTAHVAILKHTNEEKEPSREPIESSPEVFLEETFNGPTEEPFEVNDLNNSLPTLCLVRLEQLDSQVSRRSKKQSTSSDITTWRNPEAQALADGKANGDVEMIPVPLQSFIINDTLRNDSDTFQLHMSADESESVLNCDIHTSTLASSRSISTPSPPPPAPSYLTVIDKFSKEDRLDDTCLLDDSMEMTQCLSKDLLKEIVTIEDMVEEEEEEEEQEQQPSEFEDQEAIISKNKKKIDSFLNHFDKEEAPKVQEETPKAQEETPKAQEETPKAQEETPKAQEETPKAQEETPKAQEETPKAQEQTPKAQEQTPKVQEQTPKAQEQTNLPISPTPESDLTKSDKAKDFQVTNPNQENKKPNRFFKSLDKADTVDTGTKICSPNEKTPYDLSMLEASIIDPLMLKKGKENIPPEIEESVDAKLKETSMKLKDVSIVIEDIMKTPSRAAELSLYSPDVDKQLNQPIIPTLTIMKPPESPSLETCVLDKRKRKGRRGRGSPAAKIVPSVKKTKINFLEVLETSDSLASSDESWSPSVASKRKPGPKKRNLTDRRSKLALSKGDSIEKKNGKSAPFLPTKSKGLSARKVASSNRETRQDNIVNNVIVPESTQVNGINEKQPFKEVNRDMEPCLDEVPVPNEDLILHVESIGDDPILASIYEEVTNLLKNNINNPDEDEERDNRGQERENGVQEQENEVQEVDPLSISPPTGRAQPNLPEGIHAPVEADPETFRYTTLAEAIKSRPRRAATKVTSLKEPPLGCKLRQENVKKKTSTTGKKKSESKNM